jgi:hypothetical protein
MNFSIPENATSDEIEAIIERGMDAMMDAVENGGDRRSLFPMASRRPNQIREQG